MEITYGQFHPRCKFSLENFLLTIPPEKFSLAYSHSKILVFSCIYDRFLIHNGTPSYVEFFPRSPSNGKFLLRKTFLAINFPGDTYPWRNFLMEILFHTKIIQKIQISLKISSQTNSPKISTCKIESSKRN